MGELEGRRSRKQLLKLGYGEMTGDFIEMGCINLMMMILTYFMVAMLEIFSDVSNPNSTPPLDT